MKIEYKNKYVAFLDVLGFSNMVGQDQKEKLESYFTVLQAAVKAANMEKMGIDYLVVSDSIIFMVEDKPQFLTILLNTVKYFQAYLTAVDVWLRGGISYGEVYFDKNLNTIVGQGVINAYLLEQQARHPRVIIDPRILAKLNTTLDGFYLMYNNKKIQENLQDGKLIHNYRHPNAYRLTDDDAIFVCYTNEIILSSLREPSLYEGKSMLEMAYENIRNNLYSSQKHYDKYLWLKKYFTESIIEFESYWGKDPKYANHLFEMRLKFQKM